MTPTERLMERQLQRSADKFAAALQYLHNIARINEAAVTSCLDAFNHSDAHERQFAPDAVAMGIASLRLLMTPLTCHAIDLEMIGAGSGDLLEVE